MIPDLKEKHNTLNNGGACLHAAHIDACKRFCMIADDPGTTWEQWEAAWSAAEAIWSQIVGRPARKPHKAAYKHRKWLNSPQISGVWEPYVTNTNKRRPGRPKKDHSSDKPRMAVAA